MRTPRHSSFFPRLAFLTSVSLFCLLAGDVSAGTYLSSSHGGRNGAGTGVDRTSIPAPYANGNCAHCHEQHAWIGGSEPAPDNSGPSKWLLLDKFDSTLAGNAACNYCHNGSMLPSAQNIAAQISKANRHNPSSAKVTSPATLVCIDCHESHTAQNVDHASVIPLTATNLIGTNSPLLGITGKSATFNVPLPLLPPPGAESMPTVNLTDTAPNQITYEYELCFKCHAGGNPNITAANVAPQFDLANYSAHPVYGTNVSTWNNFYLRVTNPGAMNAPWNVANGRMFCSDCHGSETVGDPEGPHGSTIPYILKAGNAPAGNYDLLCLKCHKDPGLPGYLNTAWVDVYNAPLPNTALVGDHSYFGHQSVVTNPGAGTNPLGCLACHGDVGNGLASSVHGANYTGNVNNPVTDTGRPSKAFLVSSLINKNYFNTLGGDNPGQRSCATVLGPPCHVADAGVGYTY